MINSTIKPKRGQCLDCPPGTENYLTAKRCEHHYKIHRALINAEKNKDKVKPPQKPIARRSKKRIVQELQYNADVKVFLGKTENKICPVTGQQTNQVHHKKGRIGDLLNDQRFWLAVSPKGHSMIENNPEWAKENGYSLNRL